jgi:hypothetical protein
MDFSKTFEFSIDVFGNSKFILGMPKRLGDSPEGEI